MAVLHNDALPFYRERGLSVTAVLTDNGREFCGTDSHPYEVYLALNDIEHRRTRVRRPQTNGFVERFHRTVLDGFFRSAFRTIFYETVEALQRDLDVWLVYYNTERPHHGYRNLGKRSIDTVNAYPETVCQVQRPKLTYLPDEALTTLERETTESRIEHILYSWA